MPASISSHKIAASVIISFATLALAGCLGDTSDSASIDPLPPDPKEQTKDESQPATDLDLIDCKSFDVSSRWQTIATFPFAAPIGWERTTNPIVVAEAKAYRCADALLGNQSTGAISILFEAHTNTTAPSNHTMGGFDGLVVPVRLIMNISLNWTTDLPLVVDESLTIHGTWGTDSSDANASWNGGSYTCSEAHISNQVDYNLRQIASDGDSAHAFVERGHYPSNIGNGIGEAAGDAIVAEFGPNANCGFVTLESVLIRPISIY